MGRASRFWGGLALVLGLWGPAAAAKRGTVHYTRDRRQDLTHVRLDVDVDLEAKRIAGTARLSLVLTREAKRLALDAGPMTVSAVRVARGGETVAAAFELKPAAERLWVTLPEAMPRGTRLTLAVDYEAHPTRGLFFVDADPAYPERMAQAWTQGEAVENRFWFPSYDAPDDRFSSEVLVRVARPHRVLSNGALVSVKDDGGKHQIYHWRQDKEHSNYLIMLAIGSFERIEIPGHRVPMHVWLSPRDVPNWRRSFSKTPDIIGFLEEWTGIPYPWAKYDQVVVDDFMWGGMENTSAATIGRATIHDARAALDYSSEALIVHEASHQWFGDLVTCRTWSYLWLQEGFATWFETEWLAKTRGKDAADWDRLGNLWWYLGESRERRLDTRRYGHPDELFDGHSYAKGAWVLGMLERRVGAAAFQDGVRRYLRAHRGGLVVSEDLRRALEEASGAALGPFFDRWVYGKGHPIVDVTVRFDPGRSALRLTVSQGTGRPWRIDVPVRISGEFGTITKTLRLSKSKETVAWTVPSAPSGVEVDPDGALLMELSVDLKVGLQAWQLRHGASIISRYRAASGLNERTDRPARGRAEAALVASLLDRAEFERVRAEAASSLAGLATGRGRAALLTALTDQRPVVRKAAAEALGQMAANAATVAALKRRFETDESYRVAAAALEAFAALAAGETVWPVLDAAMGRESHQEVIRRAALSAMASLGGDAALVRLLKATRWGRPDRVRKAACRGLGAVGSLGSDSSGSGSSGSGSSGSGSSGSGSSGSGSSGSGSSGSGSSGSGLRKRAKRRLVRLLDDRRDSVRLAAVAGLETLGAKAAIEGFAARVAARHLRRGAEKALERMKAASAKAATQTPVPKERRVLLEKVREVKEQLRRLEKRLEAVEAR